MQVETTPAYNFVGEHTDGVTPVPIPNTAVKPVRPMIVPLARKSVIAGILQQDALNFVQGVFFYIHFSSSPPLPGRHTSHLTTSKTLE